MFRVRQSFCEMDNFVQPAAQMPEKLDPAGVMQCGCEECLERIMGTTSNCPICRSQISSLQKVFRVNDDGATAAGRTGRAGPLVGALHTDVDELIEGTKELEEDEWPEFDEEAANEQQAGPQILITAATVKDVPASGATVETCLRISVPDTQTRGPMDIACVIDTSGSMNTAATREDENGNVISDGLSILDVVKHAVKTVIHTLEDGDRLTLIGFSDHAAVEMPLCAMDEYGKQAAVAALETMHAHDSTNLWAGVHAAMEALREDGEKQSAQEVFRRKAILLLTDGMPNCKPPSGEVHELKRYFEQHPTFAAALQMSTFGFGYQLDSKLLLDLAEAAKGTTAFIPDAVITGTVFVNAVANALSVHIQACSLHLTAVGESEFAGDVLGHLPVVTTSWGRVVDLGPLHFGQTRDVCVPVTIRGPPDTPYITVSLTSTHPVTGQQLIHATLQVTTRRRSMEAVRPKCIMIHFAQALVEFLLRYHGAVIPAGAWSTASAHGRGGSKMCRGW